MGKRIFFLLLKVLLNFFLKVVKKKSGTWDEIIVTYLSLSARSTLYSVMIFGCRPNSCRNIISRKVRWASVEFRNASKIFFNATVSLVFLQKKKSIEKNSIDMYIKFFYKLYYIYHSILFFLSIFIFNYFVSVTFYFQNVALKNTYDLAKNKKRSHWSLKNWTVFFFL